MYGAHDLGGKHGLGPVNPEPENQESVFHTEWERRAFALTMAVGMLGKWNIDESRYARERQHPVDYLSHSYYENWLAGVTELLLEKGLISEKELAAVMESQIGEKEQQVVEVAADKESLRVPTPAQVQKILTVGGHTLLESDTTPTFTPGDRVRVRKNHTAGHNRAPAYVQGSIGTVVRSHGCHVFPDTHAQQRSGGEHLYSVCFEAESLWGSKAGNTEVLIDLWEPYLESIH